MTLPTFKDHPDPMGTGSVEKSDVVCICCDPARGYIYTGPVYAIEEYFERICPWCIADGSAHNKLDASFSDECGIGGYAGWCEVPQEVVQEVAYRTPGFSGWQPEQWWGHCGDAAKFLGRAGERELVAFGSQAVAAIQRSAGLSDGPEWSRFLHALHKHGSPRAYIFRCRHCGELGGYHDWD